VLERRYQQTQADLDGLAWTLQVKAMHQLYEQKCQQHWQMLITDNKSDAKKLLHTLD